MEQKMEGMPGAQTVPETLELDGVTPEKHQALYMQEAASEFENEVASFMDKLSPKQKSFFTKEKWGATFKEIAVTIVKSYFNNLSREDATALVDAFIANAIVELSVLAYGTQSIIENFKSQETSSAQLN